MNYNFKYKNTAAELLRLSLFYLYTYLAGVVNVVFTAAMAALIYSRWNVASLPLRVLLILAVLTFVLLQPVTMYRRAKKNEQSLKELELGLGDGGISVRMEGRSAFIRWNEVRAVKRFPGMLIIFTDSVNGYILTRRIAGAGYKAVFDRITDKVKKV